MILSSEDLKIRISKARLKITFLKSRQDLPGANELKSPANPSLIIEDCSGNGLKPVQHQAITWANVYFVVIRLPGNLNTIKITVQNYDSAKCI